MAAVSHPPWHGNDDDDNEDDDDNGNGDDDDRTAAVEIETKDSAEAEHSREDGSRLSELQTVVKEAAAAAATEVVEEAAAAAAKEVVEEAVAAAATEVVEEAAAAAAKEVVEEAVAAAAEVVEEAAAADAAVVTVVEGVVKCRRTDLGVPGVLGVAQRLEVYEFKEVLEGEDEGEEDVEVAEDVGVGGQWVVDHFAAKEQKQKGKNRFDAADETEDGEFELSPECPKRREADGILRRLDHAQFDEAADDDDEIEDTEGGPEDAPEAQAEHLDGHFDGEENEKGQLGPLDEDVQPGRLICVLHRRRHPVQED